MYPRFGLTLMLTHACNLRCTYCYTGPKLNRSMRLGTACAAIDRAVASLRSGGSLELGFFGGEPLLEAALIRALTAYARLRTQALNLNLSLTMTTNGTVTGPEAWSVMMIPELELSISCDGIPDVHDRHRLARDGRGTARIVLSTIHRLVAASRNFRVVTVVTPDTVDVLPKSIAFLHGLGVRTIHLSLDLWHRWTARDISRLEQVVTECARIWRLRLPHLSIPWFDEKAGLLAGVSGQATSRCGFGDGEIAVAPSGRLYPCERLIGDDADDNPMALPGHVLDGSNFCHLTPPPQRCHPACDACAMQAECSNTCRCSNYVRTGDVSRPDGLICALNRACLSETARSLNEPIHAEVRPTS